MTFKFAKNIVLNAGPIFGIFETRFLYHLGLKNLKPYFQEMNFKIIGATDPLMEKWKFKKPRKHHRGTVSLCKARFSV